MFIKIGNSVYNANYIKEIFVSKNHIYFIFDKRINAEVVEYSTPKTAELALENFVNYLSMFEKSNIYAFVGE